MAFNPRQHKNESTRTVEQPSSRNSLQNEAKRAEISEMAIGTRPIEASGSSSDIVGAKSVEIDGRKGIYAIKLLPDGEHVMSRDRNGLIQRWRTEDGREVKTAMNGKPGVLSMAVSQDGKWIIVGKSAGDVQVWNAETDEKVREGKAHRGSVCAVDISPDGSKIATGSGDRTACVWSLSGERLLESWEHEFWVVATKFSPDGRLVATATWDCDSVRVYDATNGRLLFDAAIQTNSDENNSLTWRGDGEQLFSLGRDGYIYALDTSTGTILSKWAVHSNQDARCIALASNGTFIAASANSTISFWDTSTHEQIGTVFKYTHTIRSLALSNNFDLVVCSGANISLRNLCYMLPPSRLVDGNEPHAPDISSSGVQLTHTIPELREELSKSQRVTSEQSEMIRSLCTNLLAKETKLGSSEKAVQDLRDQLAASKHAADQEMDSLRNKNIQHEQTTHQLHEMLATSQRTISETFEALRSHLRARDTSSNVRIGNLEQTFPTQEENLKREVARLQQGNQQLECRKDTLLRIIGAHEQKHQCETLYAQGRIYDTVDSVLEMTSAADDVVKADNLLFNWLTAFRQRCTQTLEQIGDEASTTEKWDEAMSAYTTALLLGPPALEGVLKKWARSILIRCSAYEALDATAKFKIPRFVICRTICELLEDDGRLKEAVKIFQRMKNEVSDDTTDDERVGWEQTFRERCAEKLVKLGDDASDIKKHDSAVACYSDALSLKPANSNEIHLKHSNEVIELEPSSHKGYQERHVAFASMARHKEAFEAFSMMLLKIDQSSDPQVLELRDQFLDTTPLIRQAVQEVISPMPRVLIDTATGRLCDKTRQAAAFEELPIFDELRSSMTSRNRLDEGRILDEVKKFYSYVMFSHRWENGEPLYQLVIDISVDELESTSPNMKLKMLRQVMRDLGFKWIWTDTCCIDKKDTVVLQESLVAMFTWYHGSSLTVVYLRGVWSHSQKPGDLRRSIWNKRVWTYQEYLAAKRVLFYTEDWKLYLDLDLPNHKESPAIVGEMELASGVSKQQMAVLQPGLDRVREKLFLASTRETTYVEDTAYSLLGIFNASIPVIYGEGDRAVGRLLEYVLTGSGDVSILAWTGCAGGYNTCLPVNLKVYSQVIPPHVPLPIEDVEMDSIVTALRSSMSNLSAAVMLHNQLRKLPSPSMGASRLRLGCIVFPVSNVTIVESGTKSGMHVYRAATVALGDVEIKTKDNLTGIEDLNLIHPWIKLFDQNLPRRGIGPSDVIPALRLIARLRQPFGALLLAPLPNMQHKRMAADGLIMARIREETKLDELMDDIDTLDIQ